MRKLFWRIFAIVWFTTAISIVVLFAISYVFRLLPPTEELREERTSFALDTGARLLATGGIDVAEQFLSVVAQTSPPVHLKLKAIGAPVECAIKATDRFERRVVNADHCYQMNAEVPEIGFLSRNLPKLIPWTSAMFAAAFAAYWLAQYLTRPVEQLRSGLRALAQGQFDKRIGNKIDRKRDEIAALAHDFDITAARLQEFQDVQQRLFHDVSHELRSPLSRLQAAIGLLSKNPNRLHAMTERLEREIARMDDLVGEILTLARLTATESQPLERQILDVVDLIREIADDCAFESAPRNISLFYEGAESCVTSVNGELIYRAIENVVRNAVKYSPSDTQVLIRTKREDQVFIITVSDQGPGIPQEILDAIFQPFRRGNDLLAGAGGFGLGLAITKHAFARHGGQVRAELPAEGGLLIRMILPV
ncbi:sensor histidine kinase [Rhizobium tropici]|uniref:histidine kinase n=1 Tax=Rhizobium tropici TaxID=398 RepID=A0A329Y3C4_RHITR|nr:HAMP domain-containing sensor histidine kinase [Rhizobium tropici]RAX37787.1 two-component sensor histidine kinase [Rhizobium tropici]